MIRRALCLVVWAAVASAAAPAARADQMSPGSATSQPRIAPDVIQVPVVEGRGLRFRRLSTADGLSQTRVAQIVQDDRGFIWFGTQYGLNRFDGYEFKVFVHDPHRANSLSGAFVTALFKDRSGALWVGSFQYLDRFDPRTETFTRIRNFGGAIGHISQDRNGTLWLATETGLYGLDPETREIVHFRHDPNVPGGLRTNDVNWTGEDRKGRFWVGTSEGLDEFDRATGRVTYHIPIGRGIGEEGMSVSFFEDRQGLFWITYASGNGLALLDRQANTLTRYVFYTQEPPSTALTGVMGILEDHDGNLWLGSPGIGLLRFDRQRAVFVHYGHRAGDPQSIAEDKVIALFEDRDGNIWTGLHSKGPNVSARTSMVFETFHHEAGNPNSLSTDFVNAIYEDAAGSLWIGNDEGLNRIDRTTGNRTFWTAGLGSKPMVITITQDKSGLVWFGTFGHGLHSFDTKAGRFKSYRHDPADPRSLSSDRVYRTFVDHSGILWVGTDDGLDRFDPRNGNFTVYKLDWTNVGIQSYLSMAEDTEGKLWLGSHHSGLHRFDPATGQFTTYKFDPDHQGWLPDNMVTTVIVSRRGVVWAGTENGLAKLEPATGRFTSYDALDGLAGNDIDCLLEDRGGMLWMSTNKGLSRFDPSSRTFINYSELDGLPGNDLTGWNSCYKSSRGEMFFGGWFGAAAFFPQTLADRQGSPAVVLTDFRLAGANVPINPDSMLTRSITYTDRIKLSHEQNIFSVTFAGLDYLGAQTTRYRYRLEGLDRQWNEVGADRRQVTYTTLPAGRYTLRVQAARSRGAWNEAGVSLPIEILPPWWETWWFRGLVGVLLIAAAMALYLLRVRQISRHLAIRLEDRVSERTRIAHELHDTLFQNIQGVLLMIDNSTNKLPEGDSVRGELADSLRLSDAVMADSRQRVLDLRADDMGSESIGQALTRLGNDLARSHAAAFRVIELGTPQSLHPVIFEEIFYICREALLNAFRYSSAERIEVEILFTRDLFSVRIRDDGIGIEEGVLSQGGKPGHFGLKVMAERAKKLGAKFTLGTKRGAGTELEISMPRKLACGAHSARQHWPWSGRRDAGTPL